MQASVQKLQKIAQVNVQRLLWLVLEQVNLLVEGALVAHLLRLRDQKSHHLDHEVEQAQHAVALVVLHSSHQPIESLQASQPMDEMQLVLCVLHQANELEHLLCIFKCLSEKLLDIVCIASKKLEEQLLDFLDPLLALLVLLDVVQEVLLVEFGELLLLLVRNVLSVLRVKSSPLGDNVEAEPLSFAHELIEFF